MNTSKIRGNGFGLPLRRHRVKPLLLMAARSLIGLYFWARFMLSTCRHEVRFTCSSKALLLGFVTLLITGAATLVKAQDLAGPKLTNQAPVVVASGGGPLNTIRVTFDEPIDPASFTAADVTLYGPMGALIPVTISAVAGTTNTQFDLGFANQTLRGSYRLTVGPNVLDVAGNPMNQNGNASNGEATDLYSGTVSFDSTTPTLGSAPVLFSEGFESWPPVPDYWSFVTAGTGIVAAVTTDNPKAGGQHLMLAPCEENQSQWATLKLDLGGQTNATDLFLDFWVKLIDNTSSGQFYVELSGDGQAWRTVINFDPPSSYQNYVIDLDAELAAGSIALDTNVFIRFRQVHQNTYLWGPKYRVFLDEVREGIT